jgi:hypothetical protein
MGANQNINLRYAVLKVESAAGTWAEPATANHVIRLRNVAFTTDPDIDDENAKFADGTHAEDLSIPGAQKGTFSCEVKCNVGAAATTAPAWWTLAAPCGCVATSAYSTTGIGLVRRKAQDDTTYSIAIYDIEIGGGSPVTTIYKFAGCMGNMVIGCDKTGAPWLAKFNFSGKLYDIIDGTAIALTSPGVVVPQAYLSHAASINGAAVSMPNWSFDLGNQLGMVPSQADATGISHYIIKESRPRFTCNILAVKQATKDVLAEFLTKPDSNGILTNAAAASKLSLNVVDAQNISMKPSSVEGLAAWELGFKALHNGVPASLIDSTLTYEDTFELLQGTRA